MPKNGPRNNASGRTFLRIRGDHTRRNFLFLVAGTTSHPQKTVLRACHALPLFAKCIFARNSVPGPWFGAGARCPGLLFDGRVVLEPQQLKSRGVMANCRSLGLDDAALQISRPVIDAMRRRGLYAATFAYARMFTAQ